MRNIFKLESNNGESNEINSVHHAVVNESSALTNHHKNYLRSRHKIEQMCDEVKYIIII